MAHSTYQSGEVPLNCDRDVRDGRDGRRGYGEGESF
jgi:hypothetical protein